MAWQPIETAPRDGTKILAYGYLHLNGGYHGESPAIDVAVWHAATNSWYSPGKGSWEPTCWMPLPEAPTHD